MEEDIPQYSAESFLPFLSVSTSEINAEFTNENNHRRASNYKKQKYRKNSSVSQNIPWKTRDSYSCGVLGLHEEVMDFYEKMRPTDQENEMRLRVIEHITRVVHSMWPHAKVEVFGSFRTGLYLPSSDIDMVIIGKWRSLPLSTLSKALQLRGISETDITIIENAKVPLVRLIHTPTKVKVDISFNMKNGVESAKMVKNLMKTYPTLPKIILVLKQYLVHRGLNEVYNGGMSSYCLTLLVFSFLQGYHKPKTLPSTNLGTLLLEFFELYGVNFNYDKVSIHFEDGGNYQPKYRANGTSLCIEDPLEKGNNVAKGTYLMHLLKLSFENTFHLLHKAVTDSAASRQPLNSYLSQIVSVDESVWIERSRLSQNYSTILRQLTGLMEMYETEAHEETEISSPKKSAKKKKFR